MQNPRHRSPRSRSLLGHLQLAPSETVRLAVPDGSEVVWLSHCTGVGKALLANPPPHLLSAVVAGVVHQREKSAPGIGCLARAVPDTLMRVKVEPMTSGVRTAALTASPGPYLSSTDATARPP